MAQPQPNYVPPGALYSLLLDILTEFMGGTRAQVIAFADQSPSQLQIETHMKPYVLDAFRFQGAEIATAMDAFFGQYGLTWNPDGGYNFPDIPGQQARWFNVRVEDINSTRNFVAAPTPDPAHTIFNLAVTVKWLGKQFAGPPEGKGKS